MHPSISPMPMAPGAGRRGRREVPPHLVPPIGHRQTRTWGAYRRRSSARYPPLPAVPPADGNLRARYARPRSARLSPGRRPARRPVALPSPCSSRPAVKSPELGAAAWTIATVTEPATRMPARPDHDLLTIHQDLSKIQLTRCRGIRRPPAASIASCTREPCARRTRPGRRTAPSTCTTRRCSGDELVTARSAKRSADASRLIPADSAGWPTPLDERVARPTRRTSGRAAPEAHHTNMQPAEPGRAGGRVSPQVDRC